MTEVRQQRSSRLAALVVALAMTGAVLSLFGGSADAQSAACKYNVRPADTFQPVALQAGESIRVSVLNSNSSEAPVWGIRVRDAGGKVVHEAPVTPPPGGIATVDYDIPPTPSNEDIPPTEGDKEIPPTPMHDLSVEVTHLQGGDACTSPIAGLQGFDSEGKTQFLLEDRWPPNPF